MNTAPAMAGARKGVKRGDRLRQRPDIPDHQGPARGPGRWVEVWRVEHVRYGHTGVAINGGWDLSWFSEWEPCTGDTSHE